MSANKNLISDRSTLLMNKLDKVSLNLQKSASANHFQTKEEYLFEAIKVVKSYYLQLLEPQLEKSPHTFRDNIPDAETFNRVWQQLLDDLTIIFTELENIESLTLNNFNFITTESNRLKTRTKAVSSKLGDYILYSLNPLGNLLFFKDSFNDLSKIELNSSLLNGDQASITQDEGIVTLPIDLGKDSSVKINAAPIINPNSNGVRGNNQQIGAPHNGDISMMLDNNPDTWFEYESIIDKISINQEPLTLDLTINIGIESVVNNITVNPTNFGTRTTIEIVDILTSSTGDIYTSIKDDIPIAGFTTEDEENIFLLAPSTSKYAGQGIYTFTPRKVKYIRFIFKQNEPYIISTPTGDKLRYAIGLRDLIINAFSYKDKGELVSKPFTLTDEIRKTLLDTNQTPAQPSELTTVNWFISPNDGAEWHEIQPKKESSLSGIESSVPEVLNFNGPEPDAIQTSIPVREVRLKLVLGRNKDAFTTGTSAIFDARLNRNELHAVPAASPFNISLEKSPIDGTVSVIDPMFGSKGYPSTPYVMTNDARSQQSFRLPEEFIRMNWPMEKVSGANGQYYTRFQKADDWIHLEVAGEAWAQAPSGLDSYSFDSGNPSATKFYTLDKSTGLLQVGNGQNTTTMPDRAIVSLWFDAERTTPNGVEDNHIATLDFPTSNNKDAIKIERIGLPRLASLVLQKQATVLKLGNKNITTNGVVNHISPALSNLGFVNQVTFINGRDEIISSDAWSIDQEGGSIYLGAPTQSSIDTTLIYEWEPITKLEVADWDWVTDGVVRNQISIKETAWRTNEVKKQDLVVASGIRVLHTPHMSLVPGTVIPSATASNIAVSGVISPFTKETSFIDGQSELGGESVKKAVESIPQLVPSGIGDIAVVNLNQSISPENHTVTFLKGTNFKTVKPTLVAISSTGDYFVDRTANQIHVKLPSSSSVLDTTERVTYWYANPNTTNDGLYSIDYENGIIYLQRPIDPSDAGDWAIAVDYEYTNFRIYYRIARALGSNDIQVDITNNSIRIKEHEVMQHILTPRAGREFISPYYLVNYDYVAKTEQNIRELEPYFSPIVKDYVIKTLPKGKIF